MTPRAPAAVERLLWRLAGAVPLALDGYERLVATVAAWAIEPDAPRA
jgi:hypothetical protein